MDATAEGIGGRKWSFEVGIDRHGFGCEQDGDPLTEECKTCGKPDPPIKLMQGAVELAPLLPAGKQVKFLLVTAPQLWEAANEVVAAERAFLAKDTNVNADRCATAVTALADMVAKAVGKQDWKDVLQG